MTPDPRLMPSVLEDVERERATIDQKALAAVAEKIVAALDELDDNNWWPRNLPDALRDELESCSAEPASEAVSKALDQELGRRLGQILPQSRWEQVFSSRLGWRVLDAMVSKLAEDGALAEDLLAAPSASSAYIDSFPRGSPDWQQVREWYAEQSSDAWKRCATVSHMCGTVRLDGLGYWSIRMAMAASPGQFVKLLPTLPDDIIRFLAIEDIDDLALAVSVLENCAALDDPWLTACAAYRLVEMLDAIGVSYHEDDDDVAGKDDGWVEWETHELKDRASDVARVLVRHDQLTRSMVRSWFFGDDLHRSRKATREATLSAFVQEWAGLGELANRRRLLTEGDEGAGWYAAARLVLHVKDDAEVEAVLHECVPSLAGALEYGITWGGQWVRLSAVLAALLELSGSPLARWDEALSRIPRDFDGWRRPAAPLKYTEGWVGMWCVVASMAAQTVAKVRPAEAIKLQRRAMREVCRWHRRQAATHKHSDAEIAHVFVRATFVLDEADDAARQCVDEFDSVSALQSAYANLERYTVTRLPCELGKAVLNRFRTLEPTWLPRGGRHFDDGYPRMRQWFEELAERCEASPDPPKSEL